MQSISPRSQKNHHNGHPCPHNSVVECFTRNEEVDGSIPSVGIFCHLRRLNQVEIDPFWWLNARNLKLFFLGGSASRDMARYHSPILVIALDVAL